MPLRFRLPRLLLISFGLISVGFGIVGAFIPVLPTTPFLLLAAACFARSSARLHRWLHENRLFGRYLRDYREGRGLPLGHVIVTLTLLWGGIGYSAFSVVPADQLWLRLVLLAIAVAVTVHILRVSRRKNPR